MLKTVASITNGYGVPQIFYPNLIDWYITVIRLTLDVFHSLLQKVFRFNMTHGPKYIALDFLITAVKLI